MARVTDPARVSSWFRPPTQPAMPNGKLDDRISLSDADCADLEIYTIWTDGFQLLTLALIMTILATAVPLPKAFAPFTITQAASRTLKPYAQAIIVATLFHHVSTGIGAYTHWARPSHHTPAMDIGVYGNVGLTLLGLAALVSGFNESAGASNKKEL